MELSCSSPFQKTVRRVALGEVYENQLLACWFVLNIRAVKLLVPYHLKEICSSFD